MMSEEFYLTLTTTIISGIINIILIFRGGERKKELSVAEKALTKVSRMYMARENTRHEELEAVADEEMQSGGKSGEAVMGRTMNVVISESAQLRAFGSNM